MLNEKSMVEMEVILKNKGRKKYEKERSNTNKYSKSDKRNKYIFCSGHGKQCMNLPNEEWIQRHQYPSWWHELCTTDATGNYKYALY